MIKVPPPEFWPLFKNVRGAFSCTEAIGLYNVATQVVPLGPYIELGTHKGKSAMASALGLPSGNDFILVDPEFKDQDWALETFDNVGSISGGRLYIRLIADESLNVIDKPGKDFSFVFIDSGTHSDDLVMNECKILENKMAWGGIIAFHDYRNQFVRVAEAYNYLLATRKFVSIEIEWDGIIEYVKKYDLEKDNNSWHIYEENPTPNFVGALVKK